MQSEKINQQDSISGVIRTLAEGVLNTDIVRGTVTQVDPIKIQSENDEKNFIWGDRLIIPQWMTDHKYKALVSTDAYVEGGESAASESTPYKRDGSINGDCSLVHCSVQHYKQDWVIVKNHLEVGDKVIMLAINETYMVLDREAVQGERGAA